MNQGLDLPVASAPPERRPFRLGRSRWRCLALALVLPVPGCQELYERPSTAVAASDSLVRISDLVVRGKVHLDPTTLRPFSGWVYGVYSEEGTAGSPLTPLLALRGRLEYGRPVGAFEFFDPEGQLIWEGSSYNPGTEPGRGYLRGNACGTWTFVTFAGRLEEPEFWYGDFKERWFTSVAPGLAPGSPAGDTASSSTYPPCPVINPIGGHPVADSLLGDSAFLDFLDRLDPTPPWEGTR